MDFNLPDHSNEGVSLKLIAFKEEEIMKIYSYLYIYSVLEYSKQPDNIKMYFKDKYENLKSQHKNKNFENRSSEEVKEYLKKEKEKYIEIREKNQDVINCVAEALIGNFISGCTKNKNYTELQKVKYLLEYISNTFKYNFSAKKYSYDIPFTMDYDFEFSNNIPVSDFNSLIVTKEVLGNELPIIIKRLGALIDLDIRIVKAEDQNTGEVKMFNAIILHKQGKDETYKVSYIDAVSEIKGEKNKEEAFLLSKVGLTNGNNYNYEYPDNDAMIICKTDKSKALVIESIDDDHKDGESFVYDDIEINDIEDVIDNDRRFVDIEYVENDIFEKKENHSV